MHLCKIILFIGYWLVKGGREAAHELYGVPSDNQRATCHAATVVNSRLSRFRMLAEKVENIFHLDSATTNRMKYVFISLCWLQSCCYT